MAIAEFLDHVRLLDAFVDVFLGLVSMRDRWYDVAVHLFLKIDHRDRQRSIIILITH